MVTVATLAIEWVAKVDKLNKDVDAAASNMKKIEDAAAKSTKNLSSHTGDAANSMHGLARSAESTGNRISSSFKSASSGLLDFASKATIAGAGVVALARGAANLAGAFFAPNASLEQMTVSFGAFIEDAGLLKSTMAGLKSFAVTTPFETPEINKAALALLNMDVQAKDVTKWLGNIGAAVSKIGGGGQQFEDITQIIAQMGVEGRITTGEMQQLQERNIPAFKILAKTMGVSVRQLKEMISSNNELIMGTDKVEKFVEALGKFGGDAMIAQSKTWNGMLSTIKDTARDIWVAFTGPLFEKARGALGLFLDVVSANQEGIMKLASDAGQKLADAFSFLEKTTKKVISSFVSFGKSLDQVGIQSFVANLIYLGSQFSFIFGLVGGLGVSSIVRLQSAFEGADKALAGKLSASIRTASDYLYIAGKAVSDFKAKVANINFSSIFNSLPVIILSSKIEYLGIQFKDMSTVVRNMGSTAFDSLKTAMFGASEKTEEFSGKLGGVAKSSQKTNAWIRNFAIQAFPVLNDALTQAGTAMRGFVVFLDDIDVGGFVNNVVQSGKDLKDKFGPAIDEAANLIKGRFDETFTFAGDSVKNLGAYFRDELNPAVKEAAPGFENLALALTKEGFLTALNSLKVDFSIVKNAIEEFGPVIGLVIPSIVRFAGVIAGELGEAIKFIAPYFREAQTAIGGFVNEVIDRFAPIVSDALKAIMIGVKEFERVWNLAWPGMSLMLEGVWNMIVGIVKIAWAIITGIIKIGLDLVSGNWGQAWEDMKTMVSNVWDGIKTYIGGEIDAIAGLISTVWSLLSGKISQPFVDAWATISGILAKIKQGIAWVTGQKAAAANAGGGGSKGGNLGQFAGGVTNFKGGMAIVGERGPELVRLPKGSDVFTALETSRLMNFKGADFAPMQYKAKDTSASTGNAPSPVFITNETHVYIDSRELTETAGKRIVRESRKQGVGR